MIKKINASPIVLSLISGLVLGLSRLNLHLGFLVFFGIVPLFIVFDKNLKNKNIFYVSLCFEIIYTITSLHWISLVTVPGYLGMFLLFGIYFYLLFTIINFVWNTIPKFKYFAFIVFWMSFEFLSNYGEFRFPWFNLGYSLGDYIRLIQIAEIGGVYLISLMIIFVNLLIYKSLHSYKNIVFVLLIFSFWFFLGNNLYKNIELDETSFKVSYAQGSIPQEEKWEQSAREKTFEIYEQQTITASKNNSDLIIWPESATPVYLELSPFYMDKIKMMAVKNKINIFTGFPHVKFDDNGDYLYYNSATLIDTLAHFHENYYKNILVPFGERIPFMNTFKFLSKLNFGQANWEYGKEKKSYKIGRYTFSPTICFEIAFPGLFVEYKDINPDFFVNITNDAWFKKSNGTYQHALMARFRAIENRREIIRSANTGYSMFVLPNGEFKGMSKLYERTVESSNLILSNKRTTLFVEYYKLFLFSCMILSIVIFLYAWIEKRFLKEYS